MAATNCFPKDLAKTVHEALQLRKPGYPSLDILTELFETLYFISLKTEELQPITCYIVYLSPQNPDPNPPERIVKDRWSYIHFEKLVPLTTSNLIKLAKASDPRTSSFAIFHDTDGQLSIWGIIDQANRYHDFVNYDNEEGPERPGIFQASIVGIGHLVAYIDYEKIAELKANILLGKTLNVLGNGPVYKILRTGIYKYINDIQNSTPEYMYEDRDQWPVSLASYWISSLCRLLLRVQSYRHGGAILITPDASYQGLNVKYGIQYPRLRTALEELATAKIQVTYAEDQIFEKTPDLEDDVVPDGLFEAYQEQIYYSDEIEEIKSELDATIWFISLLTRVDGLVLMNPYLEVKGFGVEITCANVPTEVSQADDAEATIKHEIDYNHFGTRHRSMMRYCSQIPDSIGFVISQDGDVRVMTKVYGQLVMWENIKLQRYANFDATWKQLSYLETD